MLELLAVFIGGGLGSTCRYALGLWLDNQPFPWATLAANGLACLVLGLVTGYSSRYGWNAPWKLLLATGFCGGFSTFSTFAKEAFTLGEKGAYWMGVGYVLLSLLVGFAALYIGLLWSSQQGS